MLTDEGFSRLRRLRHRSWSLEIEKPHWHIPLTFPIVERDLMRRSTTLGLVVLLATISICFGPSAAIANAARRHSPACSELLVGATDSDGASGTGLVVFLIANHGSRCSIGGFPVVELFSSDGKPVVTKNNHDVSMVLAMPKSRTITLAHNGVASFGMAWNEVSSRGNKCSEAAYALLSVRLGATSRSWNPGVHITPCGKTVSISAIESGPWPKT